MEAFAVAIQSVINDSGFLAFTTYNAIMILVGLILLYLAFAREFEPLLLGPIAFGCVLANIPRNGFEEGVMALISAVFPPLIFLGVGAMTDFGPLIANPKTLLLGAAAQIGVFVALGGAMMLGFTAQEAAAIGIIGGADGPTSIYLATKLAPHLLGAIAVAAYSYMSLVPLIQPPVMKLFTTQKEREIVMEQLREVTRFEKIVFPIVATIFISLLRLSDTSQNALINTVTIFLATGTGLTMSAEHFLSLQTLLIICLGLIAFIGGTAGGVLFGKLMSLVDGGKTNPLIGSAGVSAVPMAARVSQVVGAKANPANFLLMHAMGPNVAGVIGTAVAAGTMLAMLSSH